MGQQLKAALMNAGLISQKDLAREKAAQLAVLAERRASYTPARPPIDPAGRTVIVVDDGLATGATMIPDAVCRNPRSRDHVSTHISRSPSARTSRPARPSAAPGFPPAGKFQTTAG